MCSGCGHPLRETTDPQHQFAYTGEVVRCHACAAKARVSKKFTDDGGDGAGALVQLKGP